MHSDAERFSGNDRRGIGDQVCLDEAFALVDLGVGGKSEKAKGKRQKENSPSVTDRRYKTEESHLGGFTHFAGKR
jgi:hypothetical protein